MIGKKYGLAVEISGQGKNAKLVVPKMKRELKQFLRLLSEESKTVIFVTHSIEEAVYVSDQVVILTRGPSSVSKVVRPGIDRGAGSDDIRRDPAYLDWVEQIWHELRDYLER